MHLWGKWEGNCVKGPGVHTGPYSKYTHSGQRRCKFACITKRPEKIARWIEGTHATLVIMSFITFYNSHQLLLFFQTHPNCQTLLGWKLWFFLIKNGLTFVFSQVSDYLSLWKSLRSWKPFKVTYIFFSRTIFQKIMTTKEENTLITTAETEYSFLSRISWSSEKAEKFFWQEYPPSCNKPPTGRSSAYSVQTVLLRGLIY